MTPISSHTRSKRAIRLPGLLYLRATVAAMLLMPMSIALASDQFNGGWLIVTVTDRFPSGDDAAPGRWRYWLDAQARYLDIGSGANQLLLRPGIGYDISPRLSVWAGYARFRTHGRTGSTSTEDRYWQQLSWRAVDWQRSSLSARVRLEERELSSGNDTGIVLRAQLRYSRKLSEGSGPTLAASIEPFFNLRDTDWGADSGLSQNRLGITLGWRLTGSTSIAAGYQNQYIFSDRGPDSMNHLAIVNLRTRF